MNIHTRAHIHTYNITQNTQAQSHSYVSTADQVTRVLNELAIESYLLPLKSLSIKLTTNKQSQVLRCLSILVIKDEKSSKYNLSHLSHSIKIDSI